MMSRCVVNCCRVVVIVAPLSVILVFVRSALDLASRPVLVAKPVSASILLFFLNNILFCLIFFVCHRCPELLCCCYVLFCLLLFAIAALASGW